MGSIRWARRRLAGVGEWLSTQLWFVPALFVAAVFVVSLGLARLDESFTSVSWLRFPGGPASARSLLSSIAGAMITFTGLVFSITVLVLQLASQQFSPRVMRTFLRDRTSQIALAMFTATFTYALIVLRQITTDVVPSISVTTAVILVIVSVGVFIVYINHVAQAIRVSTIVARVGDETREAIDRQYPEIRDDRVPERTPYEDAEPATLVEVERRGIVQDVHAGELVEIARELDVVFEVMSGVGAFLPSGATVVAVRGRELSEEERERVRNAVVLGRERTMQRDAAFGFRRLVDIAERALSPSLNDPTTAVQAIDEIHDLLRLLAGRPFPGERMADEDGVVRVILPRWTWDDVVTLAVTELRSYGEGSVQMHRRLRSMLRDVRAVAPLDRKPAIERELRLLDASVERAFDGEREIDLSRRADSRGLG